MIIEMFSSCTAQCGDCSSHVAILKCSSATDELNLKFHLMTFMFKWLDVQL